MEPNLFVDQFFLSNNFLVIKISLNQTFTLHFATTKNVLIYMPKYNNKTILFNRSIHNTQLLSTWLIAIVTGTDFARTKVDLTVVT